MLSLTVLDINELVQLLDDFQLLQQRDIAQILCHVLIQLQRKILVSLVLLQSYGIYGFLPSKFDNIHQIAQRYECFPLRLCLGYTEHEHLSELATILGALLVGFL